MAHTCPECGQACYCGGDIDDCLFDFDEDVEACTCCDGKDEDSEDYYLENIAEAAREVQGEPQVDEVDD